MGETAGHDTPEAQLARAHARIGALETVTFHLIVSMARMFDQPPEFVRQVMIGAEDDILAEVKRLAESGTQAEREESELVKAMFDHFSVRMIAGITPTHGPKN